MHHLRFFIVLHHLDLDAVAHFKSSDHALFSHDPFLKTAFVLQQKNVFYVIDGFDLPLKLALIYLLVLSSLGL